MNFRVICTSLLMTSSIAVAYAADSELETDEQKFSYGIGLQIGQDFLRQGIEVEGAAVAMAIDDVIKGKKQRLTQEELQQAFANYQQKQKAMKEEQGKRNQEEGEKFLAENKTKKGVSVLPSGLQYKVITAGTGKQPTAEDTVSVHYRGTLINGKEFDSSHKHGEPVTFQVGGVIKGWTEALQLMKEGAKWQLFIPSDLAYGLRGAGGEIGPNATLIFDVELLKVQ